MTSSDVTTGDSNRTNQLFQKGLLLSPAAIGGWLFAFRHGGGMVWLVAAILAVLAPAVYLLARRRAARLRHRATEDRIVMQTRAYLLNCEPNSPAGAEPFREAADTESASNRLLPAPAGKGRMVSARGFQDFDGSPVRPVAGAPAVYGFLPRLGSWSGAVKLPEPVLMAWSELVPPAAPRDNRLRNGRLRRVAVQPAVN